MTASGTVQLVHGKNFMKWRGEALFWITPLFYFFIILGISVSMGSHGTRTNLQFIHSGNINGIENRNLQEFFCLILIGCYFFIIVTGDSTEVIGIFFTNSGFYFYFCYLIHFSLFIFLPFYFAYLSECSIDRGHNNFIGIK